MRRPGLIFGLLTAATLVGIAAGVWWQLWGGEATRQTQQEELGKLDDAELLPALRAFESQGDAAIDVWVAALGHPRPEVTAAALTTLHEQLDQWRSLPPEDSDSRVLKLSRSLKDRVNTFPLRGQLAAAEVAERLLDWPISPGADRGSLLADVALVLRAGSEAVEQAPWLVDDLVTRQFQQSLPSIDDSPPLADAEHSTPPRSDSLPSDPTTPGPSDKVATGDPPAMAAPVVDPPLVVISPPRARESLLPTDAATSPPSRRREAANPAPKPVATASRNWGDLSDIEVIRRLHALADETRAAAAGELRRRGYTKQQVRVAATATHPDVAIRRELADALPRLSGINARRWLLLLAEDPEPVVRNVAKAVLASGNAAHSASIIAPR